MMICGSARFWYAGIGRLMERPDFELRKADPGAPAESYFDLDLDTLGAPNDGLLMLIEELAICKRFVAMSLKLYSIGLDLQREMKALRYRKGSMALIREGSSYTIWGTNPIELLAEAKRLAEGIGYGWLADEVIVEEELPEGSLAKTTNLVTNTYVLREKPVVDLMAIVGQQVRARLYLVGAVCAVIGFIAGHLLR